MKWLAFVFGIAAWLACDGASAQDDPVAALDAARARWQSAALEDYRYSYQKYCDCYRGEPPVTVVTVRGGQVERVFHRHDDSKREVPARDGSLSLYWTVDELFDKLAAAYANDAIVRAEFDPSSGFPRSIFIDYDPGFSGDETDLRLTELARL